MTISRDDYKSIIQSQFDGKLTIMIDTSAWRQFFEKADSKKLEVLVNRPVGGLIWLIRLLSWIWAPLLLMCVAISIPALGWWTAAVGPIILLGGFFYKSRASAGRQSLLPVTGLLMLALLLIVLQPSWALSIRALIASLAVTLFLIRLLYVLISRFVFGLIHSSYEFFSTFYLQPAEKVGDVVIPLIWTDPEWELVGQE